MNFGQILTAMVTPFDQNGDIDFNATKTLINYLISNGTDGLVVCWYNRRISYFNDGRKSRII